MLRPVVRVLISRFSIAFIELVIAVPMALGVREVWSRLWQQPDLHEQIETIGGLGIIMIGLGVVLEERGALRQIFGLAPAPDEAWQAHLDHNCHHAGLGQLVLGLFAEISIELTKIPNSVIYTGEVDDWLVAAGCIMVGVGGLLLIRHAVVLLFLLRRQFLAAEGNLHP
ncbi:hypothetical protein [Reyranella sp.]|uniref:hypothetical protein n=1 Tax=Reyranella sp. TaxID=1929291 RepID=UPI003BAA9395